MNAVKLLTEFLFIWTGLVLPFHEDKDSTVYLGVLMCLRHMIPNLDSSSSSGHSLKGLRGSFGSKRSYSSDGVPGDIHIQGNQLLQVSNDWFTTNFIIHRVQYWKLPLRTITILPWNCAKENLCNCLDFWSSDQKPSYSNTLSLSIPDVYKALDNPKWPFRKALIKYSFISVCHLCWRRL